MAAATSSSSSSRPLVRCLLPRPPSSSSKEQQQSSSSQSTSSSAKRSRLVLLQHTHNLSSRLTASCPSDANAASSSSGGRGMSRRGGGGAKLHNAKSNEEGAAVASEDELYRLAGQRTPSESCTRDLSGGLLVESALEQLVSRTGGKVVWVKVCDHLTLPPGREVDWVKQLQEFGATVDLASDPLGWDCSDDDEEDNEEEKVQNDGNNRNITHRYYSSRMDNLQNVLDTIQRAASSISRSDADDDEDMNNIIGPPVPVIFDSITPLISLHGIAQTLKLLRRLLGRGSTDTLNYTSLSPVVVPFLIESTRPVDMRRLEDEADAIITLSGGEMRTAKRGGGDGKVGGAAGRLVNDVQQFTLQQQQQSSGAGGGGKVQYEMMVLLATPTDRDMRQKAHRKPIKLNKKESATTTMATAEKLAAMELSKQSRPTTQRARPTLQIGEDGRDGAAAGIATAKAGITSAPTQQEQPRPGPRIYVQDDDPEYDDMDEEDLDDDLDI